MGLCPADGSIAYAAFNGRASKFTDNVQSFSTVEPAIDLTADVAARLRVALRPAVAGAPAM